MVRTADKSIGTVLQSVDALLESLELEAGSTVNASIARSLAEQMDAIGGSTNGQMISAIAGIAKELRSVLDALLQNDAEAQEFLDKIFES